MSQSTINEMGHEKNRTLYIVREAIHILKPSPLTLQWQGGRGTELCCTFLSLNIILNRDLTLE